MLRLRQETVTTDNKAMTLHVAAETAVSESPSTAPPVSVGDAASPPKELERTPTERRRFYLGLHLKLALVIAFALAWAGFSFWIAIPWIDDLGRSITLPLALIVVLGIAIIPGYLNANLVASLLIDRPPPLRFDLVFPPITVLIACFDEEDKIAGTLDHVAAQDYPGR